MFCAYNAVMAKRMGRPPKSPDESLTERLYVRLSQEEKQTLESAAEKAEEKLSAWIRGRLLSTAKRELRR